MHAPVYILHEVVEVNSCLGPDVRRQRFEEQVHEHGLPTSDITKHIQALREVFGDGWFIGFLTATKQRTEERFLGLKVERLNAGVADFRWGIRLEVLEKSLEAFDDI